MKRKIYDTFFLMAVFFCGCLWAFHQYGQQQAQQGIAEKILRFHVRANSDSEEDQALKLKVRDAVGVYMQRELEGVEGLDACTALVESRLPDIEDTARQVIAEEGYAYPVDARVETVGFPRKTYGDYTFPAGDYLALDIAIGSGKGQNWWCVMYPNMCFHGAVYEVVEEDAQRSLKRVLSEDEYDAILKSGQYKFRSKYFGFLDRLLEKIQ